MRRHRIAGEAILAPVTSLQDVLSDHPVEPRALGRQRAPGRPFRGGIPLGARIVAVCDAYRAMIERRPYREPVTEREAARELRANAGTQFDPTCVRALLAVLERAAGGAEHVRLHRPARAA